MTAHGNGDDVEPYAVIFSRICPACEQRTLEVVTIPKLTSGEHFPQFARCTTCGTTLDFKSKVPLRQEDDR
jgi:hypothetical protein